MTPTTLAIIGIGGANSLVIWHVELAPTVTSDRLSGAWLLDANTIIAAESTATASGDDAEANSTGAPAQKLDDAQKLLNLTAGCGVWIVRESENNADDQADLVTRIERFLRHQGMFLVDLPASAIAMREHIQKMRDQIAQEKAKPGRGNLTEPRFPKIADLELIEFPHVGESAAAEVLGWARGAEKLVSQWAEVESVRRRREYLCEPWGKQPRPLPLIPAH